MKLKMIGCKKCGGKMPELRYTKYGYTSCVVSMDDEGNDGGVLFFNSDGVLPVLTYNKK